MLNYPSQLLVMITLAIYSSNSISILKGIKTYGLHYTIIYSPTTPVGDASTYFWLHSDNQRFSCWLWSSDSEESNDGCCKDSSWFDSLYQMSQHFTDQDINECQRQHLSWLSAQPASGQRSATMPGNQRGQTRRKNSRQRHRLVNMLLSYRFTSITTLF